MARGMVKVFPGPVKPVVEFCLANDISIMQMPCPETLCPAGGLDREPHGKKWYEDHGLRETSKDIARKQVAYMKRIAASYRILAIVGVDFSPACAVNYLNKGRSIYAGQGIFMEELQLALKDAGMDVPFVGIFQKWQKKIQRDLGGVLAADLQ